MASNKTALVEKLGSEEAYREYMRGLSKKARKRQPDSIKSLRRRIEVVADREGLEVKIEVKRK